MWHFFFFFLVSLHLLEIFPVTLTSLGARAFAGSLTVFTLGTFSICVCNGETLCPNFWGKVKGHLLVAKAMSCLIQGIGFATGKESSRN